jgi:hypothetical protein
LSFGDDTGRNAFGQPLTSQRALRVPVVYGVGKEAELTKHSRASILAQYVEIISFDPAVISGVSVVGLSKDVGGEAP